MADAERCFPVVPHLSGVAGDRPRGRVWRDQGRREAREEGTLRAPGLMTVTTNTTQRGRGSKGVFCSSTAQTRKAPIPCILKAIRTVLLGEKSPADGGTVLRRTSRPRSEGRTKATSPARGLRTRGALAPGRTCRAGTRPLGGSCSQLTAASPSCPRAPCVVPDSGEAGEGPVLPQQAFISRGHAARTRTRDSPTESRGIASEPSLVPRAGHHPLDAVRLRCSGLPSPVGPEA